MNILFFSLTPIAALGGTIWLLSQGGPHAATWILTAFMLFATGMSITAGYHRLYSHRAYQTIWPIRLFYVLFGGACFQGSVLWWCAEHRLHHRYEDTERDPYNINRGFWFAHIGWLLEKREDASLDNVKELLNDPMLKWQRKLYLPLAILVCFGLPMALGALWGDVWGGLIVAGLLRMVINHHGTFSINSFCHWIGKKTYSRELTARDSWVTALMTYGEGYHNFHHVFQGDYRNGIRAYHYDPTKWLISVFKKLGMAQNLRLVSRQRILEARLAADSQCYLDRLASCSETVRVKAGELLESSLDQLQQAHLQFVKLKADYRELKRKRLDSMKGQLRELRLEMRRARYEFKAAWLQWTLLMEQAVVVPA